MSVTVSDITSNSATITVHLSNSWNTNNYQQIIFSYDQVPVNGGTILPSQIIGYTFPPNDTNTGTTANGYAGGLQPNTVYTIWATTQAVNGKYYDAGSVTFVTDGPPRPSDFSWTHPKTSGNDFNLTAAEWNSFTDRVNQFRDYKNIANYSFITAYPGYDFLAVMYNQAVDALNSMPVQIAPPSVVNSGDPVWAYKLNGIVDALNSIS